MALKCRGLQKVQRVKRNSRMVLGKGGLGGGAALISMLVSSPPPRVGIYMVIVGGVSRKCLRGGPSFG